MRDRLHFSHLLPLIDLALLVLLVFLPITLTAIHLYNLSRDSDQVHLHTGHGDILVARSEIVPLAIRSATLPRAHLMVAINLPGALIQALISLLAHASPPSSWHPSALALETWQALVFPFFSLPFWWLVGCGLDSLVYKERLHWLFLLTGTVLFALCLAAIIAFSFPMSAAGSADLAWSMKGSLAWTIAFAILPIAWILQTLRRSAERSSTPASS
ncbi:MAG: hypothetical protein ACJ71S_00875 [Acidobacteriaceae bacterium]